MQPISCAARRALLRRLAPDPPALLVPAGRLDTPALVQVVWHLSDGHREALVDEWSRPPATCGHWLTPEALSRLGAHLINVERRPSDVDHPCRAWSEEGVWQVPPPAYARPLLHP